MMKRQQGLTAIGMIVLLSCLAFFVLLGIRLVPAYIENFKISSAMEGVVSEPEIAQKSVAEIQKMLSRRLDIDDVDSINGTDISVTRENRNLVLTADYEVRTPLLANIELLVTFSERVEGGN